MKLPSGRPLVIGTLAVCAVILAAAGAYVYSHRPRPETFAPLVFQPLSPTLTERSVFALQQGSGTAIVSTTLPVSATSAPVSGLGQEGDYQPIHGGYLVWMRNAQLCNAKGVCPFSLFAAAPDSATYVTESLLATWGCRVWVSHKSTLGMANPDILVDRCDGQPPVRYVWQDDGQFLLYDVIVPQ